MSKSPKVQEQKGPINPDQRTYKNMYNHEKQMERMHELNTIHRNMTLETHEPKK